MLTWFQIGLATIKLAEEDIASYHAIGVDALHKMILKHPDFSEGYLALND